jgi:excinuclease UvrABC nuclease subunit
VYYFYNKDGKIIYIGKAKNLRKRVASHFSNNSPRKRKQDFIKNIYYEIIDSNNESGISEKDVYDRSEEYIYYY